MAPDDKSCGRGMGRISDINCSSTQVLPFLQLLRVYLNMKSNIYRKDHERKITIWSSRKSRMINELILP